MLKKKNETRELGFRRKRVSWGHSKPIEVLDLASVLANLLWLLLLLLLLLMRFEIARVEVPYAEWT